MKFIILLASILMLSFSYSQSKDINCVKTVKLDQFNLSICLDSTMMVQKNSKTSFVLQQQWKQKKENCLKMSNISVYYNSESLSAREIVDIKTNARLHLIPSNLSKPIFKDSSFTNSNWNGHLKIWTVNDPKGETTKIYTCVICYHQQYYFLETIEFGNKCFSPNLIIKILNRISFHGTPRLKDNTLLKNNFLKDINSAIVDSSKFYKILISNENIANGLSGKDKKEMFDDVNDMNSLHEKWNKTAYLFLKNISKYKELTLVDINISEDGKKNGITFYNGTLNYKTENGPLKYLFVAIEINDKLYLGRIEQDK